MASADFRTAVGVPAQPSVNLSNGCVRLRDDDVNLYDAGVAGNDCIGQARGKSKRIAGAKLLQLVVRSPCTLIDLDDCAAVERGCGIDLDIGLSGIGRRGDGNSRSIRWLD